MNSTAVATSAPTVTLTGEAAELVAVLLDRELTGAEQDLEYAQYEAATHRYSRIRERAAAQIPQYESKRAALAQAFQAFKAAGFNR